MSTLCDKQWVCTDEICTVNAYNLIRPWDPFLNVEFVVAALSQDKRLVIVGSTSGSKWSELNPIGRSHDQETDWLDSSFSNNYLLSLAELLKYCANFMSSWHEVDLSEKQEPQFKKKMPSQDPGVGHFLN